MAQCDVRKEVGTGQSNPLLRTTRIFQFTVLASLIWGLPLTGFSAEPPSSISDWHVGGSIDLSYAIDSNFPDNHLWKSKTTTPNVNEPALNMVGEVHQKRCNRTFTLGPGVRPAGRDGHG